MILNAGKRASLLVLVLLAALFLANCSPEATSTTAPATAAPASPTEEPASIPTEEPSAVPTEEPTAAPTEEPTTTPIPEPTSTPPPREEIYFVWAPGGVTPADSDDVDGIVQDVTTREGIIRGNGNEIGITIVYDPTLITIEEILEVFGSIAHPVAIPEND
jgi:hypothetical protein